MPPLESSTGETALMILGSVMGRGMRGESIITTRDPGLTKQVWNSREFCSELVKYCVLYYYCVAVNIRTHLKTHYKAEWRWAWQQVKQLASHAWLYREFWSLGFVLCLALCRPRPDYCCGVLHTYTRILVYHIHIYMIVCTTVLIVQQ